MIDDLTEGQSDKAGTAPTWLSFPGNQDVFCFAVR